MKTFYNTIFFVIVFLAGQLEIQAGINGNIYKRFTATQCDSLIKANQLNPNFVILDVRTSSEYNGGHLMGSINRSTGDSDFDAKLAALPKHKIFLMHCQSGGRSAGAFTKMQSSGFATVYEMIGGLNAWNAFSLPTTTVTEPKLMLVKLDKLSSGGISDTIRITITNRANGTLTFGNVSFSDVHSITHNFNPGKTVAGAEDYTFSIYHTPGYFDKDSTKIRIESNGGLIDMQIIFKNGLIQEITETELNELAIYPNPASQMLYIKNSIEPIIQEISIVNLNGQVVLKESHFSATDGISISRLENGIYIVQIKTEKQVFSGKLVIKH